MARSVIMCAVCVLFVSGVSSADVILHVSDVTIASAPGSTVAGSFEVYVEATGDDVGKQVTAWEAKLTLQGDGSEVSFTATGLPTDKTHIFDSLVSLPTDNVAATTLNRSEFLLSGSTALPSEAGLMSVTFEVAAGVVGEFAVGFTDVYDGSGGGFTGLQDDQTPTPGQIIPGVQGGNISVTPEPMTMAVMLVGASLGLMRKRRIKT